MLAILIFFFSVPRAGVKTMSSRNDTALCQSGAPWSAVNWKIVDNFLLCDMCFEPAFRSNERRLMLNCTIVSWTIDNLLDFKTGKKFVLILRIWPSISSPRWLLPHSANKLVWIFYVDSQRKLSFIMSESRLVWNGALSLSLLMMIPKNCSGRVSMLSSHFSFHRFSLLLEMFRVLWHGNEQQSIAARTHWDRRREGLRKSEKTENHDFSST